MFKDEIRIWLDEAKKDDPDLEKIKNLRTMLRNLPDDNLTDHENLYLLIVNLGAAMVYNLQMNRNILNILKKSLETQMPDNKWKSK